MKKLLFLSLFFLGSYASALTLSDIQTQVRRNIRDTSTDTGLQTYSDATLTEYINIAQDEVVAMTWCIVKSTSYVLTAGTTYYDVPSSFLGPIQVTFDDNDGVMHLLENRSEIVMYQNSADFESSSTGPPSEYFFRYAADGANMEIAYIPIPDSSSTGTVTMQYAFQPTDLSGSSDVPFDGLLTLYPYHYALVARATAAIKQIEGRNEEAAIYFQIYDRYIQIMRDRNGALPSYLPGVRGSP